MPLNLRASNKFKNFNVPVSYRIHDRSGKFIDARNVNSIQDRLDTRFGSSRFNEVSLGGGIKSISFFTKSDGSQYTLAKVGGDLVSVSRAGAHNVIKSGLKLTTVHRGVTDNDRHLIAIEEDGLYSWDGETFSILGQDAPTAPTAALAAGGALVKDIEYTVALTFYSTKTGFESNYISRDGSYRSETAPLKATDTNKQINLTNIPASAENAFVDKVYVYLKNKTANGPYLFAGEVDLGITSFTINAESLSSQEPPMNNGAPRPGGGKYLASFNSKTIYAGNEDFPNEVYFSEEYLPDAYNPNDSRLVLPIPGKGSITGLGVGLFGDSVLDPFLVIFKRKSTRIYSEVGGLPKMVTLSEEIGCVSHDTIREKNGVIYFLSEEGWRAIADGRFITDKQGDPITLGNGDIDDIFKSTGYYYEVNRQGLSRAFSVYYPTLDQYITWVSEGTNSAYTKAYVYEFDVGGFKPYEFAVAATCATLGENSAGRDMVLFGTADGFIMSHSIMEERSDRDSENNEVPINAFAVLPWAPEDGDYDATYNYRELILKAVVSNETLTVKTFLDYNLASGQEGEYQFADPNNGFILDQDILDVGVFGDERSIKTARSDINRVGESIAIGFYQSAIGANIGLVSMQIDLSKNGNRNSSNDNEDEEGGFDADSGDYLPSVSESVRQAAAILAQIQAMIGNLGNVAFSGYSERFDEMWESNGVADTFEKILQITYAGPLISLATSPSSILREKGTVVSTVTLTATTTRRSNDITEVRFYRNGVLINTVNPAKAMGGTETFADSNAFSDTTSFYAQVDDGTSTAQSSTVTHTFVYPYYYGAGVVGLTAAQVAGLTKNVISSSSSLNRSFTTTNGQVYYFAYPASYGALTSILDENGFETFADWTMRTENITGLDGSAVSYRIYEFNNPVVAGSTDYTFRR